MRVELPLLRCYRCVYSWRPVKTEVVRCPRCKSRLWNVPKIRPPALHPSGLGVEELIVPHRPQLQRLRRRYHVRSLRVYGSVARGEAGPNRDIGLLVEYDSRADLLTHLAFRRELSRVFGRPVDLCGEAALRWSVRP